MKKFSRYIAEKVNEKQIMKDLDSGMSADAVISKYANKKTTNTDEIRKVIKQHAWNKRMKKEETELDEKLDKDEYHIDVAKGEFKTYKNGDKKYKYLYDLEKENGDGDGPMLVTIQDLKKANKIAAKYGGKVSKTKIGTYRIVKEETELSEVSAKMARRAAAASQAKAYTAGSGYQNPEQEKDADRLDKKSQKAMAHVKKRQGEKGVNRVNRMTGKMLGMEETDQIDELSKNTLIKYVKKSNKDLDKRDPDDDKSINRETGLSRATKSINKKGGIKMTDRLRHGIKKGSFYGVKEETDQIDEISPELAARYHDKAGRDMRKHADNASFARDSLMKDKKNKTLHYTTKKERGDMARKSERKLRNRAIGMSRAGSRMEEIELDEKSVSQAQQKLMGMALAYKRGEMNDASDEVKKLASSMSEKDLEDFAKTKHKGLPKKVDEKLDPVGQSDSDIDNDGDVDSSDKYLHKRRKAIAKAIAKKTK